jgi:hypothetical protein
MRAHLGVSASPDLRQALSEVDLAVDGNNRMTLPWL